MNIAVLFDTMSIQHYVFGSNKLKENLGASYLVETVYQFLENKEQQGKGEIGYIGGGNALFYVSKPEMATALVTEFTTRLLYEAPGLTVAVAIDYTFSREDQFREYLSRLFKTLAVNKGKYAPINIIPSHGITAFCLHTGHSAEQVIAYDGEPTLLSSVVISKISAAGNANEAVKGLLVKADMHNHYTFTDQLEELGHKKYEDSHIAVVYIDGNGFGAIFKELKDEAEFRKLSEAVGNAVQDSFVHTLQQVKINHAQLDEVVDFNRNKNGKWVLPVRPIIMGGDDITFVCHGKLGLWLAETFMQKFNSYKLSDGTFYSSCAGVSVVKAKYPFYRAYKLAEELCTSAKKKRKELETEFGGGSWIDFHLSYGGLGNSLEEIRTLQYQTYDGIKVYSRPYITEEMEGKLTFADLKSFAGKMKHSLPNSKIKDFREILNRSTASKEDYIEQLRYRHKEFADQFCTAKTPGQILDSYPFFDMIELLELYPMNLINA